MTTLNLMALVDGSEYSVSVCDHASWLAGRSNAAIEIIHVLSRREGSADTENLSGSIGLGARTALLEELVELDARKASLAQKRGRAILEDARQRITEQGVENISTKLRHGELVETVEDLGAQTDVIVIGKRGESADFEHLHLGSNLERVARSVHLPILVASRQFKPIDSFLIAFDGGASINIAIENLASQKLLQDLQCEMLMVGNETVESADQLKQAADVLTNAGYSVNTRHVSGQPEQVISEVIETENHGLLVMGAFGHSRIRNLIIGSTTTEMLRACKVPVFLYR